MVIEPLKCDQCSGGAECLVLFHSAMKGFRKKEQSFSSTKPPPNGNGNNIENEAPERTWHIASVHTRSLRLFQAIGPRICDLHLVPSSFPPR